MPTRNSKVVGRQYPEYIVSARASKPASQLSGLRETLDTDKHRLGHIYKNVKLCTADAQPMHRLLRGLFLCHFTDLYIYHSTSRLPVAALSRSFKQFKAC